MKAEPQPRRIMTFADRLERRRRARERRENRREWITEGLAAIAVVGAGIALLWILSGQI